MKTTFIRQETSDKLTLQGLLYEPDEKTNKVVLHIHGMAGNFYENKFLDYMAKTFTDNGWAFLSVNTRGHDLIADFGVVSDKEEYRRIGNFREKFEDCVIDIKCWIDYLETNDFSEIVLQGHSLGSAKVVYYLAQTNDLRIRKLVLASPPDMVSLFDQEDNHSELLEQAKKLAGEGKGDEILSYMIWDWYYLSSNTYLDFAKRDNAIDVFNTYDKEKSSVLSKIKVPILAFFGSKDDAAILPLEEALEIIKSKAKNCPQFDTEIIENASHVYFGKEKEVSDLIIKWVKD